MSLIIRKKVSIKPKSIAVYGEIVGYYNRDRQNANLRNNVRTGDLSDGARRRLNDTVEWFIHGVEPEKVLAGGNWKPEKINFVTLTISSKQQTKKDYDHNRKVLNQFLTEIRSRYGVKNYIWKLEKQKNGNIHYHLLIDKRIPHYELRVMWNRIQNKFGYVDLYRNKHKRLTFDSYCKMYPFYKKKNGRLETKKEYLTRSKGAYDFGVKTDWRQPNSTDIHSLKKIKDVASYITKYFSKDSGAPVDEIKIEGQKVKYMVPRLWGCSQDISKLRSLQLYPDEFENDRLMDEYKTLENEAPRKDKDYITVILVTFAELVNKGYKELSELFLNHINEFRLRVGLTQLEFVYN